jgi:hypothetical protein
VKTIHYLKWTYLHCGVHGFVVVSEGGKGNKSMEHES